MSGSDASRVRRAARALLALGMMAASQHAVVGASEGVFVPEPGVKGYGVLGVPGDTIAQMLAFCASARPSADAEEQLRWQRCSQLRRSLNNQPGNGGGGR